jgi:nucleoside-diphosphate-sugar epimerase
MRVAILGAGGQIGTALVKRYAEDAGLRPVAVLRNAVSAARHRSIHGVEVRVGDVCAPGEATRLVGDCDAVVNCAIATGLPRAARAANAALIGAVASVARETRCLRAFVHLSSVLVYGAMYHPSTGSRFERPRPTSAYGRDKLHAERVARRAFADTGVSLFVVRLGHVYGPLQANSRAFLAMVRDRAALPFAGALPSNAIHTDRLASVVAAACRGMIAAGTYNGVDHPNLSWREVFDWHTSAAGIDPVGELPADPSERARSKLLREERTGRLRKVTRDVTRAFTAVPAAELAASQAIRDVGYEVLSTLPEGVERKIKAMYTRWSVGRQVASIRQSEGAAAGPAFFSDAVPGPSLSEASGLEVRSDVGASREFADWIRDSATPDWFG